LVHRNNSRLFALYRNGKDHAEGRARMLQLSNRSIYEVGPNFGASAIVEFGFHQQFSCWICRNEESGEMRKAKYCAECGARFEE